MANISINRQMSIIQMHFVCWRNRFQLLTYQTRCVKLGRLPTNCL